MKRILDWIGWGLSIAGWGYFLTLPFQWNPYLILIIVLGSLTLLQKIVVTRRGESSYLEMPLFLFILFGISFGDLLDIPHLFMVSLGGGITYFITLYARKTPEESI